tara:strand:- start:353 stop:1957 length:1605 start_codon:yes stop_codon:yes gene_type:complete
MAINKLKTQIKAELDAISKKLAKGSGGTYYYGSPTLTEVTFKGPKFIKAYTEVTEKIIKGMVSVNPGISIVSKYNTPYQWKKALADAVAHISTAKGLQVKTKFVRFEKAGTMVDNSSVEPILNSGVYADELSSTQLRLTIVRKQGNKQAEDIFKALKDLVWNMWVEIVNSKIKGTGERMPSSTDYGQRHSMSSKDPATGKAVKGGRVIGVDSNKTISSLLSGAGIKASHTADTSSGLETLRRFKDKAPALSASHLISTHDLAKDVEKGLKVGYARQRLKKKTGGYTQVNFISLDIATNPGERTDIKELKKRMVEAIDDRIKAAQDKGIILSPKDESSKSFNNAVAEDAIIDMLIPLTKKGAPDKRFKIVKNLSAKKFKQLKDDITIMTGGGIKPVSKMVSMRASGKIIEKTKPAEKGQESQQVDLLRLRSAINKRLPAEVRRNMGKPALTNRTGNFSNSVELLRLKYTRAGISGDYTYTKSGGGSRPPQPGVYQTFENSGRWPAGYNPKDLITKSIRNLATQYTEERFVQLRRR